MTNFYATENYRLVTFESRRYWKTLQQPFIHLSCNLSNFSPSSGPSNWGLTLFSSVRRRRTIPPNIYQKGLHGKDFVNQVSSHDLRCFGLTPVLITFVLSRKQYFWQHLSYFNHFLIFQLILIWFWLIQQQQQLHLASHLSLNKLPG